MPFYRQKKLRYANICNDCDPPIQVPQSKGVPTFELTFENLDSFPVTAAIVDACSGNLVNFFLLDFDSTTLDDGTVITKIFFDDSFPALPEGTYYLQIPFTGAEVYSLYSEDFKVCNIDYCYKLKWSECTNNPETSEIEQCLYFDALDFNRVQVEQIFEEKTNGRGQSVRTPVSTKFSDSFAIHGNDYMFQTLSTLLQYENVELEDLTTGEVISLNGLTVTPGEGECSYPITLQYLTTIINTEDCCDTEDLFTDLCIDVTTEPQNCEDYSIMIVPDLLAGTLSFSENGGSPASSYIWLLNGAPVGTGTSISIGNYGTYSIQGQNGECSDSDSFSYLNPCNNITLSVNVNGAVIAGSASGDDNIVISVCNSIGLEIGVGLPFTVPESEGNGTFIVKAKGDNCEAQQAVFVTVEAPFICEHNIDLQYNATNNIITGSTTGCTGTLESEFIELEDEQGTVTVVSVTNTHTVSQTGNYWYNAICDGCLLRTRRLVIITEDCPDVGTECNPLYIIECEKDSGEDTKITLPA